MQVYHGINDILAKQGFLHCMLTAELVLFTTKRQVYGYCCLGQSFRLSPGRRMVKTWGIVLSGLSLKTLKECDSFFQNLDLVRACSLLDVSNAVAGPVHCIDQVALESATRIQPALFCTASIGCTFVRTFLSCD